MFNVIMGAPSLAPAARALLVEGGCTVHDVPGAAPHGALAEMCRALQADAILAGQNRIDAAVLDASPRLRIVARHGVGVDSVDIGAAADRGIIVTRAPGSNARAVAEHTMALILALAKDLRPLSAVVADGGWRADVGPTRDLVGLRLGLVGYGAIGQMVASLAAAFSMDVAAHHPSGGLDLDRLLRRSDVLSMHCPLTLQTRHMIGAAELAALPRGAIVVNTARGGLIDEAALLEAVDSGQVAAAGLDVFEREPPGAEEALRCHPRVIATPHIAGSTPDAMVAMGVMAAECIVAALSGAPIPAGRIVPG
jgi:D-3-phosphoglycerate dehydrogenase